MTCNHRRSGTREEENRTCHILDLRETAERRQLLKFGDELRLLRERSYERRPHKAGGHGINANLERGPFDRPLPGHVHHGTLCRLVGNVGIPTP